VFFSLSKKIEKNFPCYFALGDFVLNVDLGWHRHEVDSCVFVYKGYIDGESFEDYLINPTVRSGNFCVFRYDKNTSCCDILTDRYRNFIMWSEPGHFISNLYKTKNALWANSQVQVSKDFNLHINYVDPIGDIVCDPISYSDAQNHIHGILQYKTKQFIKHNTLPLRSYLSGGIDTLLVYSYITQATNDYQNVLYSHIDLDYFWGHNKRLIQENNIAYTQIHHWNTSCVLTSGAGGDEYFLRDPNILDLWLSWHGYNLLDFVDGNAQYDQTEYYKKWLTNNSKTKKQIKNLDHHRLIRYLCTNLVNNCQHHHLSNTLTFTPLKDLEIFKTLVRMSPEQLKKQISTSQFSMELISRNNPKLLSLLAEKKNSGETLKNLCQLIDKKII